MGAPQVLAMIRSKIGILQGRLTAAAELQVFPVGAWQEEFAIASEIGFDTLEWLLDDATGDKNPLWSAAGRGRIRHLSEKNGLPVTTLCADYIQQSPLSTPDKDIRQQRLARFRQAIKCATEIGVQCILLPCFEDYLIPGTVGENMLVSVLQLLCEVAQRHGIRLGLEMSWKAENQVALVRQVAHPALGIYYDTGNATAEGYDVAADIRAIGPMLVGVHLKDRQKGGSSVLLGEGDTKFEDVLSVLWETGFTGPYVLETPRGNDPVAAARRQLEFVKTVLRRITV